jgi:hypothetical protein
MGRVPRTEVPSLGSGQALGNRRYATAILPSLAGLEMEETRFPRDLRPGLDSEFV